MCGGLTGIANWAVAIAPDTLKSRLQTGESCKYKSSSQPLHNLFNILLHEVSIFCLK